MYPKSQNDLWFGIDENERILLESQNYKVLNYDIEKTIKNMTLSTCEHMMFVITE